VLNKTPWPLFQTYVGVHRLHRQNEKQNPLRGPAGGHTDALTRCGPGAAHDATHPWSLAELEVTGLTRWPNSTAQKRGPQLQVGGLSSKNMVKWEHGSNRPPGSPKRKN